MAVSDGTTLEEILGGVAPEKLDQTCQDEHLCEIARHITDWPALAPLMGITTPEMEEIRGKWPFSIGGQRMELMSKWKGKHGRKGTYQRLCKTFLRAGKVALAEKVCEVLCSQQSSSESSYSDEPQSFPDIPQLVLSPDPELKQSSLRSRSSTPATTTALLDQMEPLANELRITYGCQTPDFIALQWPPPPTLKVFNLALIRGDEIIRRRPLDETLVRLTVAGNVENIMKIKVSIKLEDLFKGCHVTKDRKVILIEGAPGSGKSTLAWDICLKWKAWEMFNEDFKIVIYVQLRDLDVQSAQEIADLLPLMLHSERKNAASLIEASRGVGVLFVLDGWDEYTPGLQQDSLFEKLICRPKKLSVELSTVLITSRPIASGKLQPYATSRVEIVGFTPDDIGRYFEDVFKDPLTVQKLYNHLEERPLIKASCYLPLNAAIVAHLFMELNYTLPTTLHGLFSLVLSCIIRHLTKESQTDPEIMSLDDLPSEVQEIFQKICVIAYEGIMHNKVIFSTQDLCSYGLPKNLNTLSLMQVMQRFATCKPKSYHFLHLSIQELLAAHHISNLPPFEQVRTFTEKFGQLRFDTLFCYYSAFTKLQTEGIRDVVARMVESAKSKEKALLPNLMHCLFEAQDISLCHFVSSQFKGRLNLSVLTLSPFDLLSLKYFLSCVNDTRGMHSDADSCGVTISELNLSFCRLTSEDINSLSLHNLVKLNLTLNRISCVCAANILTNNPQLEVLHVRDCDLTDDGVELFAAALRDHHSLEVLDLRFCSGITYGMHHILQGILNHRSLRDLYITHCYVNMKDAAAVLEMNDALQVLKLGACDKGTIITATDSVILARSLRKNKTLDMLQLVVAQNQMYWVEYFVWSLQDCYLKTLNILGMGNHLSMLNQMGDRVNEVRRQEGLPPLEIRK